MSDKRKCHKTVDSLKRFHTNFLCRSKRIMPRPHPFCYSELAKFISSGKVPTILIYFTSVFFYSSIGVPAKNDQENVLQPLINLKQHCRGTSSSSYDA